jgi:predicted short-subunit dehydrogenase-like oxidoreductase (DUF2520 family)
MTPPRLGFVGAGRLANALAPALARAGYPVVAVANRTPEAAHRLAKLIATASRDFAAAHRLPDGADGTEPGLAQSGCSGLASAQAVADAADVVFLTVPDGSIRHLAGGVQWRPGAAIVHCSGAAGLELLTAAVHGGTEIGSFHPLQTFAQRNATLAGVTVAIQGSNSLLPILEGMATALGCRPMRMPAGLEPTYHASAALAGNYLVTLLAQAARLWQPLGCSEEDALVALLPLARTVLTNLERLGSRQALTGPIARGDVGTVRRHLQALTEHAPDLIPLYCELASETLPLAGLNLTLTTEIESILSESKETEPCV